MAEKNDWSKLPKRELLEMLQRQEKLLANKRFLLILPDKGKKVLETVERLKELIAQKEKLEDTVTHFEKLTVSQLVQRTQLDVLDSDDSDDDDDDDDDDDKMNTHSDTGHPATSEACMTNSNYSKTTDTNKLKKKQFRSKSSGKMWDYESSATPPTYTLENAKPLSLEESFKLLQDQEKRHRELQTQHATQKLREQSSFAKPDFSTLQVLNPRQYRETVQDDYLSDDSQQEENDIRHHEMDSDDVDDDDEEKT